MCGFNGFWEVPGRDQQQLNELARGMADAIRQRGPDADGVWSDPEHGLALGHRRLSIIDLSAEGSQPMVSHCGRYVLAFNGEVYSFPELRQELEADGCVFRGHSDTEVVLEYIARHGLAATLERSVGMFAFALWDRHQNRLTLVRDRLGIKPLYWGVFGSTVMFASEIGPLRRHPDFRAEIDPAAVTTLLRHNYIGGARSVYRGLHKLEPGCVAVFGQRGAPRIERWWSARAVALAAREQPLTAESAELDQRLDQVLRDAVRCRMLADVPLGAFLSGGIDSSTVVALMQAQSSEPVRTFTIGFRENEVNEAVHARRVADHLGTHHTEMELTHAEAQQIIPDLPVYWDEPFSDSSQIPTYLVSKIARRDVTVSLSGDGGDELFGGYDRFFLGSRIERLTGKLPRPLRKLMAGGIRALPAGAWSALARPLRGRNRSGERLHALAAVLSQRDEQSIYRHLVSHWKTPADLVHGGSEAEDLFADATLQSDLPGFFQRMMLLDTQTYLPGDILTKVDRASMAVSLEARVPLLDHRVYELAWRLPDDYRIGPAPGKGALRRILGNYVPREMFERPKQGFGIPLGDWLRGPLRDWAEDLLDERRMEQEGVLRTPLIQRAWKEHLSGQRQGHYLIWDILMFQGWYRRWHSSPLEPSLSV